MLLFRQRPRAVHVAIALSFLPWLVLLGWLTRVSWFITDDAFISFRYARNLLEGHGLVFNRGEYVEGYTNFLWVIELAAIWGLLGIRPEVAAQWLSVIYTVGTVAVMLWWVARLPALRHRWLVAWMAMGVVCSSATFAVWTSGGGLETRQFTFFVLAAVAGLSVFGTRRWGLVAASLSLAAAGLTRPEGLLVAACCVGWFVVQRALRDRTLDWRGTLALAGPVAVVIGGHFLARYRYYGEWLPNTYYAKHVDSWYESGYRYLSAAAIETGLYLLLPLAYLALRARWREGRDGTYALVLLLVGAHMIYLFEIGGDHFEYRPLDFYWPLLAVPAAGGLLELGHRLARARHRRLWPLRSAGSSALAVALFVPLLFYASAMQGVLLFEGADHADAQAPHGVLLDSENPAWLLAAPGMPMLVAVSGDLRQKSRRHSVGVRYDNHREYADNLIRAYQPYEDVAAQVIPDDAVAALVGIGVLPFYVPNLTVVDLFGLVDPVVARNPTGRSADERVMAHDRSPPRGYLRRRGPNIVLRGVQPSAADALTHVNYALRIGDRMWMPFDVVDHAWANQHFSHLDLRATHRYSQTDPAANRFMVDGATYVGQQFLGRFEEDRMDGWTTVGKAVSNHAANPFRDTSAGPTSGHVGPGFLTTYFPGKWERFGHVRSPAFTATSDQYLAFLIAGESHDQVGLRLLAEGAEIAVWRGDDREAFELVLHPLQDVAGQELQLEIFNHEIGDRPRLMLDHVMLVRQEAPDR